MWGGVSQDQLLRHALPMELVVHGCGLGSAVAGPFPVPNVLPIFRSYGSEMLLCSWYSADYRHLFSWFFDGQEYRIQRQPRHERGTVEVLHRTRNWREGVEECKRRTN